MAKWLAKQEQPFSLACEPFNNLAILASSMRIAYITLLFSEFLRPYGHCLLGSLTGAVAS